MSDEGERICPLCAEAMDLTDQQLKPCKCGYEICVWCWHHIMEMAEKQEMEGRCPACRTPYDKDRIVGMSSKCEKLVAEMNGEKKTRSQKARSKSMSEARKHLGSVRVIQRNLVYIIGLPLNSCDENVLQRREYFGQYGKILKVSVSRPSTGTQAAQQAPSSNTFNVYITYTKEEEAIRCIQAVHNFVLDGKQLRACFGTTKYCHAWLRNMPCNNPDCFYLHDVGSQEDSFTKDEIISAYTRTRVPQISSNSSHRRLGNVLPPPADDFNNVAKSSAKSAVKISSNSCASAKIPPTCSSLPRSAALPAAASWGSRLSNSASSIPCSNLTSKKKQENPLISLISASSKQSTVLHKDLVERGDPSRKGEMGSKNANTNVCGPSKDCVDVDSGNGSNLSTDIDYVRHTSAWHNDDALPSAKVPEGNLGVNSNGRSWSSEGSELCADRDRPKMSSPSLPDLALDENILSSWDEDDNDETCISSKMIEGKQAVHLDDTNLPVGHSNSGISKDYESNEAHSSERSIKPASNSDNVTSSSAHAIEEKEDVIFEWINDSSVGCSREWDLLHTGIGDAVLEDAMNNKQNMQTLSEGMASLKISSSNVTYINGMYRQESKSNEGLLPPEMQKLSSELPIDGSASLLSRETPNMVRNTHFSRGTSEWITEQWKQPPNGNTVKDNLDIPGLSVSDIKCGNPGFADQTPSFPHSGHSIEIREHQRNLHEGDHYNTQLSGDAMSINPRSTDISSLFMPDTGYQQKGPLSIEGEPLPDGTPSNVANRDMRESSIISNILSLDVNPWDVSSPNDFVKLLSETNKQIDGLQLSSLLKGQSSSSGNNQSRFPFARMESHSNYMEPFHNENGLLNTRYLDQSLVARGLDDSASQFRNGNPLFSYDNTSVLPRTSASAPPGFSHPNRLPPPGFSSQNRLSLTYETSRAYQIPASSIPSNQGQVCLTENSGDVEFIDPAILAVGKGRMPFESNRNLLPQSFPTHVNAIENDRSHLLLQQQSASALQDCMISGLVGNMCLPSKDAYVSSQFIAQNNVNVPHFTDMSSLNMHLSKSNWDSWNEAQSRNDLCNINDLHMLENLNELFGLNKYFPGGREHEFLYNRAFGM